MKKDICKIIKYKKYELLFKTNDEVLYNDLKNEYRYYFDFINFTNNKTNLIQVKAVKNEKIFTTYIQRVRNNKLKKIFCDVRRNNIIVIDKEKKEVILIYDKYSDEKLQHIEEIIVSIFGKNMEQEGYMFLHAFCVSKNGKGFAFLKENAGNNIFWLRLLNESYNFVASSKIGLKINNGKVLAVSIPTRLGMKLGKSADTFLSIEKIQKIRKTAGYKENFHEEQQKKIFQENNYKFNLTFSDIEQIFNINILDTINIDYMIDLHYLSHKEDVRIKKMKKNEIYEVLINNKEKGIYLPVSYLEKLYSNSYSRNYTSEIIKNGVKFVKVFQNEENCNQFIEILKGRP